MCLPPVIKLYEEAGGVMIMESSWRDILKINVSEDWIEEHLITQEEYDKLSNEEKVKYHRNLFAKYRRVNLGHTKEAKYHVNNTKRLLNNPKTAVNKPHPTEEKDFKHKHGGRRLHGPYQEITARGQGWKKPKELHNSKYTGRPKVTQQSRVLINQMIIDYFKIYNRRFGRNPTLQDIENEEGRPLTVDEIDSFKRYAQSR